MPPPRSNRAALIVAAALALALATLAVVQYGWIQRLAEADARRVRASTEFAARLFSDDFDRELTRTFVAFQLPLTEPSAEGLLRSYDAWAASARDPRLISAIYFAEVGSPELKQLDLRRRTFVAASWPPGLTRLQDHIARFQPGTPHEVPPFVPPAMALVVPCGGLQTFMRQPGGPGPLHGRGGGPMMHLRQESGCPAFTILQINREYLATTLLPELTRRYFPTDNGRNEYAVALRSVEGETLYSSAGWMAAPRADFSVPIFNLRIFPRRSMGDLEPRRPARYWELMVRYRQGSLPHAVEALRRRHLLLAMAIVVILGGSAATLVMMLRRAHLQQHQQLEFVAGITHELNTPLAALQAAGQNLADGIVSDREQVTRYGGIVLKEARRLSDMVSQVLDYAGLQSRRTPVTEGPVDIREVIEDAIAQSRWMAEEKDVRIESNLDGAAPTARGDAAALTRAVQNLVANAIRHGGDGGWVGVTVRPERNRIAITVEDRGPGIPSNEASKIFEPFFRGAAAARVRGSGLGLTIVDQIVRSHGGSVTVDRHRTSGAAFTIHLPADEKA